MQRNDLPHSLRKDATELAYRQAKLDGTLLPLDQEVRLRQWEHWYLIENRFPYDAAYIHSHMLVPKRAIAEVWELTPAEFKNLGEVYKELEPWYDIITLNTHKTRSIHGLLHFHLLVAVVNRDDVIF